MDLCIKYLRWILYSIRKSSSRLSETLMLEIARAMIATYTISCWCTRKTAQNKQLTGYVLWKICECERTRDSRLLLSDVSPQDCDQCQVSWWPGGQDQDPLQWETFSYFRRLPGDYSRYITFTSPLPLRCCWIRNLRSSELRLALGASSQHWHSAGYSDSTPAISNAAVHWRFSNVQRSIGTILLCTFITFAKYIFLSVSAFACQTSNLDMFSKYWNYSMNQAATAPTPMSREWWLWWVGADNFYIYAHSSLTLASILITTIKVKVISN